MTVKQPLISVIVPTRNSEEFIKACLESIQSQTYKNIEVIVVDRNSKDKTKDIAREYTDKVFDKEPERSTQRNYGVSVSNGKYVAIIDSDMELEENVIADCIKKISTNGVRSIIIPEVSFGNGFWAKCKELERSFYAGVDWIEAARFFYKKDYLNLGGYNEAMISGEDWDLSKRAAKLGRQERIDSTIRHNEGRISLWKSLKKKYYYASKISIYVDANDDTSTASEITGVFKRFGLYFSDPIKLLNNPAIGLGMLLMKVSEFGFSFFGWLSSRFSKAAD